jgi:hypothetical protein
MNITIPAIAAAAAALISAPTAKADITPYDQQFLNALAQGQWHTSIPQATVNLGHDQCNLMLYNHWTPRQAADSPTWSVAPPGSPGVLYFVKTAITFYCPQYLSEVDW